MAIQESIIKRLIARTKTVSKADLEKSDATAKHLGCSGREWNLQIIVTLSKMTEILTITLKQELIRD